VSDPKNEKLSLLINSTVALSAVLLSSFLSFHFAQVGDIDKRKYELNRQALSTVLEKTIDYSSYSTVNWDRIRKLYRPYNCVFDKKSKRFCRVAQSKRMAYGQYIASTPRH
jgi:hypothetical protein